MTTLHGTIFKLTIKYAYLRDTTYYYQRKIPLDLQSRYGSTTHIKENLKTINLSEVAKKVTALNKHYVSTWDAMRGNASITPSQIRESATLLLKQYGLNPLPHNNSDHEIDQFIESILEPKRIAYADGDELTYSKANPSAFLSETEQEAVRLLNEQPRFMLTDALDFYLNMHVKSKDADFREYNTRIWKRFVSVIGDKPFEDAARADGHLFVSKLEAENLRTGTIRRNIRTINAIYNHGLLEKSINKQSPFKSLKIAGEGKDTVKRETFDDKQLDTLRTDCMRLDCN